MSASRPARPWATGPASPPPAPTCSTRSAGTSTPRGSGRTPRHGARRGRATRLRRPRAALSRLRPPDRRRGRLRGTPRVRRAADGPRHADGPAILCLQAGNLHSGAFDPMREAIALAHEHGAWVHVDGAFGLWAAASPALRDQVDGIETADSWATDAHKTLNVPYDCGVAIISRAGVAQGRAGRTDELPDQGGRGVRPLRLGARDVAPSARRSRWAALRQLGRSA